MRIVLMILIAPFIVMLSLLDLLILCISLFFLLFRNVKLNEYIKRNFIAVDQRANTLFLGNEDETISSRLGKHMSQKDCPICNFICWLLNLVDKDHCLKSIEIDEEVPYQEDK